MKIIPLREKIGSYDDYTDEAVESMIIPLREKIGSYDWFVTRAVSAFNYTTTRENWELRLVLVGVHRRV